jgi:hypothetical protein
MGLDCVIMIYSVLFFNTSFDKTFQQNYGVRLKVRVFYAHLFIMRSFVSARTVLCSVVLWANTLTDEDTFYVYNTLN